MKPVLHLSDFSIEHAEAAVGEPASAWPNRCHEIASKIVNSGVLDGLGSGVRAVYGHYKGPVHPSSIFYPSHNQVGLSRHGWIALRGSTYVIDPTRWVFEGVGVDPYIFYGEKHGEYDEGGNELRMALRKPCPPFDRNARLFEFADLTPDEWQHLKRLAGHIETRIPRTMCFAQVFWLANLTPEELMPHTKVFYASLKDKHLGGLVPIDNQLRVKSGDI